ncbi:MAG: hypothetical protein IJG36_08530 [Synergistaceae bacterium]|nr:hypothetical protein [Synergistaceae bacterium]MBR0167045.1 hypothetical protein [Synergistaceae bacterium]MBR0279570.1 hypothetical protein [Synergistaceae bacterium]
MSIIYGKLWQFTDYIKPMDFTIHQYLLASEPSILLAAGTVQEAERNIPEIKRILGNKSLSYIFISHMETDEAGGVFLLQKEYPDVCVICGNLSARELYGWGYSGEIKTVKGGECLNDGELSLRFINYPSEVHLQDGLLCFEENSGVLYSSDLMMSFGDAGGKIIESEWKPQGISEDRLPAGRLEILRSSLGGIIPEFVAVGHGFCIKIR